MGSATLRHRGSYVPRKMGEAQLWATRDDPSFFFLLTEGTLHCIALLQARIVAVATPSPPLGVFCLRTTAVAATPPELQRPPVEQKKSFHLP